MPKQQSVDEIRAVGLNIRLTIAEREKLHQDAEKASMNVSDYIREKIGLGVTRR